MTDKLRSMQSGFRRGLVRNVKMFVVDVVQFRNDFEGNGPMVPGIAPMEANERLRKFQRLYEQREHKYNGYAAGEQLFGLPHTALPDLDALRRRGVASSLLEAVDAHARREKLERVILHVEDDNDAAIAFYEAQDFVKVRVDKDLRQFGTALGLNPDIHYLFSREVVS